MVPSWSRDETSTEDESEVGGLVGYRHQECGDFDLLLRMEGNRRPRQEDRQEENRTRFATSDNVAKQSRLKYHVS